MYPVVDLPLIVRFDLVETVRKCQLRAVVAPFRLVQFDLIRCPGCRGTAFSIRCRIVRRLIAGYPFGRHAVTLIADALR